MCTRALIGCVTRTVPTSNTDSHLKLKIAALARNHAQRNTPWSRNPEVHHTRGHLSATAQRTSFVCSLRYRVRHHPYQLLPTRRQLFVPQHCNLSHLKQTPIVSSCMRAIEVGYECLPGRGDTVITKLGH